MDQDPHGPWTECACLSYWVKRMSESMFEDVLKATLNILALCFVGGGFYYWSKFVSSVNYNSCDPLFVMLDFLY